MCGIAGAAGEGADAAWLSRALDRLAARGPDGTGEWRSASGRAILGHRRLAILDTSPRGCQPSLGPDRASAFVHNGEIYNFRELRGRLEELGERFVSESDGEVVHRLLRRDGPEALSRLEGMFALALWNEDEGRLLLARDPIGIKPLYYARLPRGLAFASQPSALLSLPELAARLDPDALADFLAYGYVPFDRCLFAGIRKLPAAHRLLYDAATRTIEITRYWRLERSSVRDDPEELRARLDRAVSSHLVSDVPVGAFLSGGLDSTLVVARAARSAGAASLPTFTVAYRDGDLDDFRYARLVSSEVGTPHRDALLDLASRQAALDRAAEVFDEPLYDARSLAMLELSRLARADVKVALSGDGGDEVFGGYGWHETSLHYEELRRRARFAAPLFAAADRAVVRPLARTTWGRRVAGTERLLGATFVDRYFPVRGFFGAEEQAVLTGRRPDDPAWLFRLFDRPDFPGPHRLMALDLHTYLPDNGLALVDRSTMAVGLEARVPLLDRQLVEYAFSLPPESLVRPGATKIAFRRAVTRWVPPAVASRAKKGFSPPFKRWVQGPAREQALALIERGDLAADGVIRPSEIRGLLAAAPRRHNKLWLLLTLEAWYGRWIRRRDAAAPDARAPVVLRSAR